MLYLPLNCLKKGGCQLAIAVVVFFRMCRLPTFPFSEANPIQYPGPPPISSDVVIIGGGVIGVTTALFLARRNISVTLVEKGRIAAEQSSRNWGWIRKQGRDADELPIVIEASRHWQQLAEECGEDIGLTQTGVTYLASSDHEMAGFEKFMKVAAVHKIDTCLLNAQETADLIKGMSRSFKGAMTTPSDMRAEPWVAVPALARLAARKGVKIVENCAARILEISAGRVSGVWTEAGHIETSCVLLAGGVWSSLFLRRHGVSIPQLSVRSTVAATEPMPEVHAGAAAQRITSRSGAGRMADIRSLPEEAVCSTWGLTRSGTRRNTFPPSWPIHSGHATCRLRRRVTPIAGRRHVAGRQILKVHSKGCGCSIPPPRASVQSNAISHGFSRSSGQFA